jgi:hypothetical protein
MLFSRLRRLVHGPIDSFKAIIQALDNQHKAVEHDNRASAGAAGDERASNLKRSTR